MGVREKADTAAKVQVDLLLFDTTSNCFEADPDVDDDGTRVFLGWGIPWTTAPNSVQVRVGGEPAGDHGDHATEFPVPHPVTDLGQHAHIRGLPVANSGSTIGFRPFTGVQSTQSYGRVGRIRGWLVGPWSVGKFLWATSGWGRSSRIPVKCHTTHCLSR